MDHEYYKLKGLRRTVSETILNCETRLSVKRGDGELFSEFSKIDKEALQNLYLLQENIRRALNIYELKKKHHLRLLK